MALDYTNPSRGHNKIGQKDFIVSFTGLEGTGKSTIIAEITNKSQIAHEPTQGVLHENLYLDGITLGLTDLGGDEIFRKSLWRGYIKRSDALVYVVDATKKKNMKETKNWFNKILDWKNSTTPLLVILNQWNEEKEEIAYKKLIKDFKKSLKDEKKEKVEFLLLSPSKRESINETIKWIFQVFISKLSTITTNEYSFVSYLKLGNEVIETKISSSDLTKEADQPLFDLIRCRFANKNEQMFESMEINDKYIVMSADEKLSCWLITEIEQGKKVSNILMRILTEIFVNIEGIANDYHKEESSDDLNTYFVKELITNHECWVKIANPIIETTRSMALNSCETENEEKNSL